MDHHATARAFVDAPDELPAAQALAARRGLCLEYDPSVLQMRLTLRGPGRGPDEPHEQYVLVGDLTGYRLLPPVWRFIHPLTGADIGRQAYPKPVGPSVLHDQGLICAHWSRLAYQDLGGPHGDWGGPRAWQQAARGNSLALTIPDMLSRLILEVSGSRGRMEDLAP